jgi:hypothetical protein
VRNFAISIGCEQVTPIRPRATIGPVFGPAVVAIDAVPPSKAVKFKSNRASGKEPSTPSESRKLVGACDLNPIVTVGSQPVAGWPQYPARRTKL